ncbi:MAG: hypothetical protein A2600_11795 [Candidatus Lambdaproteobacteria bacterium RIFOXYD1_FULL_56_27]|uniref:Uncharacterized protein n=1 Tax=Candidatus Lambdaproteobacteria bacterium RIFOXYD2_FULL_56_26 TaxID=1817773 RepID=A0A1F6GX95_9PROT|nr:MAG: hypothetical protein A2426_12130 [Candidatus Lambdaproteobacteria bacterium RIFOXYC1_FULL_56_13]OGH02785.1 MAG: hypothetical protein A2557_02915 [Candidatus Lambdaproteobacteria bacterium RIFOXYD2_FULL_56_26]OGH08027.1 MAG: hypothetical protein A2600_11795 [Candidatus Lambdaproteobacteria bacterium RIFOXYD1_FULL_56_27]
MSRKGFTREQPQKSAPKENRTFKLKGGLGLFLALALLPWSGSNAIAAKGTIKASKGICANRTCRFLVGEEELHVVLRGVELADIGGSCVAERRLYLFTDRFLRALLEAPKSIELSEIGEEKVFRYPLFNLEVLARPARVLIDGKDLAKTLSDAGFAVSSEFAAAMEKQAGGVWCGPLQKEAR